MVERLGTVPCRRIGARCPPRGAACGHLREHRADQEAHRGRVAFLSDFENVPKWNYAIVEARKVSEGPVGVGTVYQQVRSVPRRSEERFEVTAYSPPRHLEIRGQLGPFPSRLSHALDAVPEGTRVTNSVELELRGPGRLLGRVAVARVRDAVAANLSKLKELLDR